MKKKKKSQKVEYSLTKLQLLFIKVVFVLCFFVVGIFNEFVACIFVALELSFIFYLYHKNKKLILFDNLNFILMIFIVFMYLFSVVYAIDRGMALIGFVTILTVILFVIIVMQLSNAQREEILQVIPISGIIMIIISVISFISGIGYSWLFVNDRMGGFFQYPNTFALFLLIGTIIINNKQIHDKKDWLLYVGLIIGILLTGSRTVYIITAGFLIYFSMKNHSIFKINIGLICGLIVLFGFGVLIGLDIGVLERLTSINLNSSTLLGRLLYYKDGIFAAIQHPLGLGYLGYYFIESQIQTGVYSIRFIHNDFLQMILDVGFIPGIMFIFIVIKSLLSKNISKLNKQILLAITLHCMFDFSLQYKAIFFIYVLGLDFYSGKEKDVYKDNFKILKLSTTGIASIAAIYLGVTMSFYYFGYTDLSIKYLPFYSEPMISKLSTTENLEEGVQLAQDILKINDHVAIAYDVLAVNEYSNGNYSQMINYKEQSIDLQKYNMSAYDNYITMLSVAIDYYQEIDEDRFNEYVQKLLNVPVKIEKIEQKTSSLAYRIADQPNFELSNQSKRIIQMFGEASNN